MLYITHPGSRPIIEHHDAAPPMSDRVPSKRQVREAWDKLLLSLDLATLADLDDALDIIRRRLFLD